MKRVVSLLVLLTVLVLPACAWENFLEVIVGQTARGATLSPDEKTIYVGAILDRKMVAFDARTGDVIADVLLTNYNSAAWAKGGWVDERGDVFVPATGALEIYHFDSELFHIDTFYIDGFGIENCEGVVTDSHGNLYAFDRKGSGGVYKIDKNGNLDTKWGSRGWADVGFVRLGFLKDGYIYAVDNSSSTLFKVDVETGKVTRLATLASGGFAVAVDDSGKIYVAHYNDPYVAVSIYEDGKVSEISRSEFGIVSNIGGIAVTRDGSKLFLIEEQTDIGGLLLGFKK